MENKSIIGIGVYVIEYQTCNMNRICQVNLEPHARTRARPNEEITGWVRGITTSSVDIAHRVRASVFGGGIGRDEHGECDETIKGGDAG